MTELISAKSRLTIPGFLIRSEMLCTPWRKISSAALKAFNKVSFSLLIKCKRSFGIITRESTCWQRFSIPFSACSIRRLPSNLNGFVTIPTVRTPKSRATSATIGAAPVPVPPPIPAVINTISAPFSCSAIFSRLSDAALEPISGFAPAPFPFVELSPIVTFSVAIERFRACWSVLIAIKSTPFTPDSIILSIALPPPPPTPTTFI